MSKKRKLNSKNPKYWDKSKLNEKVIKKKVLYCETYLFYQGKNIYAKYNFNSSVIRNVRAYC